MSEAKFTKGEWVVDKTPMKKGLCIECNNVGLCDVYGTIDDDFVNDESIANAHLIAAAPDMYALLEDAQDLLTEMYSIERKELYGKIEQLLAKARGEN